MNNQTILIKIKQRINKLDSKDFDNIECWMFVEAFNKAQVDWCRRQLAGSNVLKQGDEQSTRRIDDLQSLLREVPFIPIVLPLFSETPGLPADYFAFKRLEVFATKDCCKDPRLMTIYQAEEANAINALKDNNKKPSFEWAETFMTFKQGKIRVYTNSDFTISSLKLMYYSQPIRIQIAGCMNPYTGTVPTVDVIPNFKDDVVEVLIDGAAAILAGDIESLNEFSRESNSEEKNN